MDYNPLAPEVQANPFPYYAALRRDHPVAWLDCFQCWTVSRYDDVDFALRNPQLFSSANWLGQSIGDLNPAPEVPWMRSRPIRPTIAVCASSSARASRPGW
jgi:cytochrome P450